ncbi:hypothetical protein SIN09_11370 [Streptomyces sp. F8]|uniref:hypothetical protein n=1 Tax=Streptomyces sp. F8 TaxID=1436085 RepID=UPI0029CE660B|nr:hypothetical protein [Streptomyces sp. F8]MDX6760025.1 hypothetical protein [Streptomyces sp. F8]
MAATKVRPETCFGAFTPAELAPVLGRADEVTVDSPYDMRLNAQRRGVTCNIYVDGQSGLLATATWQPTGRGFRRYLDNVPTEPVPGLENSQMWATGAAAGFTCTTADGSFEVELKLSATVDGKPDATRRTLVELMGKYVDRAKQQNQCGA